MTSDAAVFACVPNVSEGRDEDVLDACAGAIVRAGATLAHRTSDAVHHRSVFTFFGGRHAVLEAAVALAAVTTACIDLRAHRGAHPRIGALDVLPFVPFGAATREDAIALARAAGARIWEACGVPAMFYGEAATSDARRSLPDVRRGEFEGLIAGAHPTGAPDIGTRACHPQAGAVAIGVRGPLVAYNVVLATGDIAIARRIARELREAGGGPRGLRCLAIALDDRRVQVSCNLTNPAAVDLALVYDLVVRYAAASGVAVASSELIGLVPRDTLARTVARDFGLAANALPLLRQAVVEVPPESA